MPVSLLVEVQPDERMPASGRARIIIEVSVTKDGLPSRARLVESSGVRDLDDQVLHDFESQSYQPALLDGVPIDGLYRSDGSSLRR